MLKKSALFLLIFFYLLFFPGTAFAQTIVMQDDFESDLSGWMISGGPANIVLDNNDPVRKHMLNVNYQGQNEDLVIKKNSNPSDFSDKNLVFEIEFWDDSSRDYGLGFYVLDEQNRYIMLGVNNNAPGVSSGHYFLKNGKTVFDTGVARGNNKWRIFQIFVTEVGAYAAIDGQSLVYLRGKIPYPNENPESFPINNQLVRVKEVGIEYPSWEKPASASYWDNFKVYKFREHAKSVAEKEEEVILDFLNKYENDVESPKFAEYSQSLRGVDNFQLGRLALAGAYGVRAKKYGQQNDWGKFDDLLSITVDDYQYWKNNLWTRAIYSQAIAQLASWRWQELDLDLRNKIISLLLSGIPYEMAIDPARPNGQGDSKSEENAWSASYLGFMADFLYKHPDSDSWENKAEALACNSTSSQTTNSRYPCEVSQVLTPEFLLWNHGMINVSYTLSVPDLFAQAVLFRLNRNLEMSQNYRKNIQELYNAMIVPGIRWENYTYKAFRPEDTLIATTGRDDWGQDATLQDPAWAYLDKVLNTDNLNAVVNYAWLTRGGGTIYPTEIGGLDQWSGSVATHFFLNTMDAWGRFVALFMIDPVNYKLQDNVSGINNKEPLLNYDNYNLALDVNFDGHVNLFDLKYSH